MALRIACHDSAVHRDYVPEGPKARAVFDAVEQARCEALGARAMPGVGANLGAMLEDRYFRGNFQEINDRADAPLEDAVALMVRERLTGEKPPRSAEALVSMWRPWIEEKAGGELSRLDDVIGSQKEFARAVRGLLVSLDMADELGGEPDEPTRTTRASATTPPTTSPPARPTSRRRPTRPRRRSRRPRRGAGGRRDRGRGRRLAGKPGRGRGRPGARRRRGQATGPAFSNQPPESDYKVFTQRFDELTRPEDLCDGPELDRLRAYLDKQLVHCRGRSPGSPTGSSGA